MKYSPNMTPAEMVEFEAEIRRMDEAYAAYDDEALSTDEEVPEDEMQLLRKAALDCRGRP